MGEEARGQRNRGGLVPPTQRSRNHGRSHLDRESITWDVSRVGIQRRHSTGVSESTASLSLLSPVGGAEKGADSRSAHGDE